MPTFEENIYKGIEKRDLTLIQAEKMLAHRYFEAFKMTEKRLNELFAKVGTEMTLAKARESGRLGSILKSLKSEYTAITKKTIDSTIQNSAEAYTNAYLNFANASKAEGVIIGGVSKKTVLASVMNKKSTYNIIKTFDKNLPIELNRINGAITRGIATGESYARTASKIEQAFNNGFSDALRVVRTEEARNWTEGHLEAYREAKELGLDVVNVWLSQIDDRSRDGGKNGDGPNHVTMDGEKADMDGLFYFKSGPNVGKETEGPGLSGYAEDDINCRCALTTILR